MILKDIIKLGITAKRALMVQLNKVARSKAKALKDAGYTGEMTRPPVMNARNIPPEELTRRIMDLDIYNRNKLSTVEGMEEFKNATLNTLNENGYDFVDEENLSDFGRFMNSVREKHYAKSFPSNEVATLYSNMERLGISSKTMERHFKGYLASQEGIGDLLETLEGMKLPEGRKRISSTEVKEEMKELGLYEELDD